ncbi:MAG: ATP-binding protein [Caldilineaceae bacterium]
MTDLIFVQMSGAPGSGKTTVAHGLARETGAVVIDHDVTKSALLAAEIDVATAGRASYVVLDALARHLLQQGHSVIFDSPCLYAELLARGQKLAAEAGAAYRYVECILNDIDELDRRLRTRQRWPSQIKGVYAPPVPGSGKTLSGRPRFEHWIANMKRPDGDYLVLDTARPPAICVAEAIAYVKSGELD